MVINQCHDQPPAKPFQLNLKHKPQLVFAFTKTDKLIDGAINQTILCIFHNATWSGGQHPGSLTQLQEYRNWVIKYPGYQPPDQGASQTLRKRLFLWRMHRSWVTIITTVLSVSLSLFAVISVRSDLRFRCAQLKFVNFSLPLAKHLFAIWKDYVYE